MTKNTATLTLTTYADAIETMRNINAMPGFVASTPKQNENNEYTIEVIG